MAFNYSNAAKSLGKKIEKKSALAAPSQAVSTDQPVNDGGSFLSRATSATGQALLGFGKFAGQATKDVLLGADIDVFGKKLSVPGVFTRGSNTGLIRSVLNTREGQNLSNIVDEKLKPVGTAQGVGYTAGAIAEAFIPGIGQAGVASKAPTLLKAYPKLARWTPVVTRGVSEGVETLGVTARQRKEVNDESLREAAYSAVLAPLGKIPRVAVGSTQVGQGVYQMAEGDTMGGATNIAIGLAQAWSGSKTKGLLLDEPISFVRKQPQVSGSVDGMRRPVSAEPLPTLRQRLGERINKSALKFTKSDIDAGADVRTGAIFDVQRGNLGDTLDATQRRISGYNNIIKEVIAKNGDPMVIDGSQVFADTRKKLTGVGTSLSATEYETIIDDVEKSLKRFLPDWGSRKLSAEEGLKLRRELGKQAAFHHDPLKRGESTLKEQVYNSLYVGMMNELEANLPPQFQGANKALAKLIPYQNAILRRMPIEDRQNILGLTDNMTAIAGLFDPKALALGYVNRTLRNPGVGTALMQSGPLDKPFMPGDIPEAPNYPRLPAPGDIPYRAPTVIELPSRTASTMSSRVPENFPRYTPQQAEALRLKSLEETASRAKDMPIMSRQAAYQEHEIRTMENSRPAQPPEAPNMLAPRSVGEFTPEPVTRQSMKHEALALKEQLDAFSYPDEQMEIGYNEFKKIASRSTDILDDITDSDAFIKRYGKEKYRTVIEDSVKGGGLTNDELLDTYRMRYQTEQHVKQRIERMNGSANASKTREAPPVNEEDPFGDPTLYHGTASRFTEFDPARMRIGNGGYGVYLTSSKDIANYHSYAAKDNVLDKSLGRMPYTNERQAGEILQTQLKPGLKMKEFKKMPEPYQIEAAKKEGYDAISFPDEVIREDWNSDFQGPYPKSGIAKTTVVFDPKNVIIKNVDLLSEAKKYRTSDEFVKAQGITVYRGGSDVSKEKITEAGISVSKGRSVAEDFVKQKGGNIDELIVSPNAKIVDYSDVPDVRFKQLNDYSPELDTGDRQIWKDLETEYQKAVNWAKANGYDGVKLPLEGETRIINQDVITKKAKLIDIWNQANKNTP